VSLLRPKEVTIVLIKLYKQAGGGNFFSKHYNQEYYGCNANGPFFTKAPCSFTNIVMNFKKQKNVTKNNI
jgi:hypothetical protein